MSEKATWTPSKINFLLNHLEAHKGENGLYLTNRKAACKEAAELLTEAFPSQSMTPSQVSVKLTHLNGRRGLTKRKIESFFREGRCTLCAPYNEASTLDPGNQARPSTLHPGNQARSIGFLDNRDTSPDELGEEIEVKARRGNGFQLGVLGTSKLGQHLRDLSLPLNLNERESSSDYVSCLDSDDVDLIVQPLFKTDGSRTASQQALDDSLPLSKVNQPTAGPSEHSITPPRTATQSYREDIKRIQEYLEDDPDRYIPFQEILIDQKSIILIQLDLAIESLLDSRSSTLATQTHANTDYQKIPRFYDALSDDDFSSLCIRSYGVGTIKELHEKIDRSCLYMKNFLRGLLAAAVTDWVFEEHRVSIQRDIIYKTASSQAYEREIKQVSDELHEQFLRKSRSFYVNDEDNFEDPASDLSVCLRETLKTFLNFNHLLLTGEDSVVWLNILKRLFLSSLKLKAQTALRSGKHKFRSPSAGDTFDPKMMTTEEGIDMEGDWKVQITLFPTLVQTIEPQTVMDDAKEVTMFPATVLLQ